MEIDELWSDDVLARREDVLYLQKYIVRRYLKKKSEPGFVIAVNADWGFGKSFMLERWKKQAAIEGHPAIFFDAWKSDFTKDPLLAFIAELDSGLKSYFKMLPLGPKLGKAAINAIKKSWKPALMVLGSAMLKHGAGLKFAELSALIDESNASEGTETKGVDVDEFQKNLVTAVEKALKSHLTIKQSIEEFRDRLGVLVAALERAEGVQLPLIVFIDELDRCRPDYAIQLLEGIKHLFGVSGVFFVIATNVNQLGESVKAVYGNGFNGRSYLKRFFDLQYLLRDPDSAQFSISIFKNMALPTAQNIIYGLGGVQNLQQKKLVEHVPFEIFSYILKLHVDAFGLGLRDIVQIAVIIESSLITLNFIRVHPFFLIFLAVIFHADHELFSNLARTRNQLTAERLAQAGYQADRAKIEFRVFDDDGRNQKKVVELVEIAKFYLSMFVASTYDNHLRSGENRFPKNLVDGNSGRDAGHGNVLEFAHYFSLVQHAGSFST